MSDEVVGRNKVVFMTYSVLSQDGQVMGQNDVPTGYVHGAGSGLFEKIERSLEGHRVGDRIEVSLSPEEGFGPSDPDLIIVENFADVPPSLRRLGGEAEAQNDKGEVMTFRVVKIADGKVTLDGNHPLAGQNATCVVEILSVRQATPEEIKTGFPAEQGPPQLH
ncbi:MAG: peptidylprolyl isomerase [Hydrogenophilaceae bacterium]|nr:peptidylprolyl isomerase [Hydrogenophilaceae bacterium]